MKSLLAIIIGFALFGCAAGGQAMAQDSMKGVWEEFVTREGVAEPSVLTLELNVVDGRIAGWRCESDLG